MSQAKTGDKVKLNFIGKLEDGTIFDSSDDCLDDECDCQEGPMEFTIGGGETFPALEEEVIGMRVGESRIVQIEAIDGYGEHNEEMVVEVDRSLLPEDLVPEEGQVLEMTDESGEAFPVWITAVDEKTVTLDANHPLAGKDLTFELELLEILPPH